MFSKLAQWFAGTFGSAKMFAFTVGVVLLWAAAIPWLGFDQWNSTLGLAGNTIESTVELFFAIAIQFVANNVESGQREQMNRIESLETLIETEVRQGNAGLANQITALTSRVNKLLPPD